MNLQNVLLAALLPLSLLAGCAGAPENRAEQPDGAVSASSKGADVRYTVVPEAFLTAMTPENDIDSPAAWNTPDGSAWVIATAKATDRLVIYDGADGRTLRTVGASGDAPGAFLRPNGVAVIDDLLFVVERDNHRVQVLRLPDFVPVGMFGASELVKPYGLWVQRNGSGFAVFVTDAYMAGEDAAGEDILPPLADLGRRVRQFSVTPNGNRFDGALSRSIGDTTPRGALRVVESIWGDAANDRLLIAEEDETYANELKAYTLDGRFVRTVGRDVFGAQAEGIMLKTCAGGGGWWITTEQGKGRTVFHLFDRKSLAHVGAVTGATVANTDGIWLHDVPSARFPDGVLYAVHDDQGMIALDWREIATALALPACPRNGIDRATTAVQRDPLPNTLVPMGAMRYEATAWPDRIVASPAQDASRGFGVAWRTDAGVDAPWLELVVAGDSPDMGPANRFAASSSALRSETGLAQTHRVHVDGLAPDTLYAYRVQGNGTWSPWQHFRTAAPAGTPLTLLYFGDTQNQNASLVTRVIREAQRHAPDARLALFAGDLVSGGDGQDDIEWGEWFDAGGSLLQNLAVAPAIGNHEYWEEFEDTPQERRVLGEHFTRAFSLPANGLSDTQGTTYWFDYQDVRVVVLDGTSALDLGTAQAQARWLDGVLGSARTRWTIALIHQPMFSPRADRENALLVEHVLPVLERRRVDLVLQGHDHTYGRRGGNAGLPTPQFLVSVAGIKQYRISNEARHTMKPTAEDTQLFQVLRLDGNRLRYESRTATGRLYDAFELIDDGGRKRLVEITEGRIAPRDCPRMQTLEGREDRCWE